VILSLKSLEEPKQLSHDLTRNLTRNLNLFSKLVNTTDLLITIKRKITIKK